MKQVLVGIHHPVLKKLVAKDLENRKKIKVVWLDNQESGSGKQARQLNLKKTILITDRMADIEAVISLQKDGHTLPVLLFQLQRNADDDEQSGQYDKKQEVDVRVCSLPVSQEELKRTLEEALIQDDKLTRAQKLSRVGPWYYHPQYKVLQTVPTAKKATREIKLTEKEAGVLDYLLKAPDRVVGKTELLEKVWQYNAEASSHTLETHIYKLRRKIEQDPNKPRYLITEEGGYRLLSET